MAGGNMLGFTPKGLRELIKHLEGEVRLLDGLATLDPTRREIHDVARTRIHAQIERAAEALQAKEGG